MKAHQYNFKLAIIASIIFLVGLGLVLAGMLGVISGKVAPVGSLLIFVALLLRILSFFRKS